MNIFVGSLLNEALSLHPNGSLQWRERFLVRICETKSTYLIGVRFFIQYRTNIEHGAARLVLERRIPSELELFTPELQIKVHGNCNSAPRPKSFG